MQFLTLPSTQNSPDKPKIDYPCTWTYKVIGEDQAVLRDVITDACAPHAVIISLSHRSSKGKYYSVNAETVVPDETTRLRIYAQLKGNTAIKIVL